MIINLFLGRIDNVVNSGGIKLIPEQIEEKLSHGIHSRFCRWNCRCCIWRKISFVMGKATIG
jgi:hypothetical protein